MNTKIEILKYVILGDAESGKTAFTEDNFSEMYMATIGVDFKFKLLKTENSNTQYRLQLWDTSGQERFKGMNEPYKETANVFIVMFDVTRIKSFEYAKKEIQELELNENYKNIPIILVGNKSDLPNQLDEETINEFNKDNKYHYIPTSAKTKERILDVLNKGSAITLSYNDEHNA